MTPGAKILGIALLSGVGAATHVMTLPERAPFSSDGGAGWPGLKLEAIAPQSFDGSDRLPKRLANRPTPGMLTLFEQEQLKTKRLLGRSSSRARSDDPGVDRFGWRDSPSDDLTADERQSAYPSLRERRGPSPRASRRPLIARSSSAIKPSALKNGSRVPKSKRRGDRSPRRLSSGLNRI